MLGSWPIYELPNLVPETYEITSSATRRYNCIAWAAGEDFRNWWPDSFDVGYWPPGVPRQVTIQAFIRAYGALGYRPCIDGALEPGVEKIALYGKGQPGAEIPTHAALQLESGQWTSKLGPFEDVSHTTPEAASGPIYGKVIRYLVRPRPRSGG